jgi:hypothetical protein
MIHLKKILYISIVIMLIVINCYSTIQYNNLYVHNRMTIPIMASLFQRHLQSYPGQQFQTVSASGWRSFGVYPLVTKIAIENGHLEWNFPWKMVIFHSYVTVYQRAMWYLYVNDSSLFPIFEVYKFHLSGFFLGTSCQISCQTQIALLAHITELDDGKIYRKPRSIWW